MTTEIAEKSKNVGGKSYQTLNICELPTEIVLIIFSYLTGEELVTASRVCVRWLNILNNDATVWKDKAIPLKGNRIKEVEEMLGSFHNAKSFAVQTVYTEICQEVLKMLYLSKREVKMLDMRDSTLEFHEIFKIASCNFPGLEKLLLGYNLTNFGFPYIISELKSLRTMSCFNIEGRELNHIIDVCPELSEIDIYYTRDVCDNDLSNVMMKQMKCLKVLEIDGSGLRGTAFTKISECPLYKLTVDDCRKFSESVICSIIKLPCIKYLTLNGCNLKCSELIKCFEMAGPCLSLRKLQMDDGSDYDEAFKTIKQHCPNLKMFIPNDVTHQCQL